jgi:hypothetical protein
LSVRSHFGSSPIICYGPRMRGMCALPSPILGAADVVVGAAIRAALAGGATQKQLGTVTAAAVRTALFELNGIEELVKLDEDPPLAERARSIAHSLTVHRRDCQQLGHHVHSAAAAAVMVGGPDMRSKVKAHQAAGAAKHVDLHGDLPMSALKKKRGGKTRAFLESETQDKFDGGDKVTDKVKQLMEEEVEAELKKEADQKKAKEKGREEADLVKVMEASVLAESLVVEAEKVAEELLSKDKFEAAEHAKFPPGTMRTGAQYFAAKVTAEQKVVEAAKLAKAMVTAAKKAADEKVEEALRFKEAAMAEAMQPGDAVRLYSVACAARCARSLSE